ncbi:MAG: ABC transporter permease [Terriglobales bacterium]
MSYAWRRLARAAIVLVATSIFCFILSAIVPGSYFDELRMNPQVSPQTIQGLREQYGLDRPLPTRYWLWVRSAARGDFGYSFAYNAPVGPLLLVRARNTLLLTATATLLAWLLAVPLGAWTAWRRGGWLDRAITTTSSFMISVPEIAVVLAVLAFAVRSRMLPVGGMVSASFDSLSWWGRVWDIGAHLIVPATVLAFGIVAIVVRHVRSSVAEVLESPYIEAARGNGIRTSRLLLRHVLPAAANPAISLFGLSLAALLSGSLTVEVITGWPGLGPLVLEATLARDPYVVIGAVMLSAVVVISGTLIADLLLLAFDPRISTRSAHA